MNKAPKTIALFLCCIGFLPLTIKSASIQTSELARFESFELQVGRLIELYTKFSDCEEYECFISLQKRIKKLSSWEDQVLLTSNYLQELKINLYKSEIDRCQSKSNELFENKKCNAEYVRYLKNKLGYIESDVID